MVSVERSYENSVPLSPIMWMNDFGISVLIDSTNFPLFLKAYDSNAPHLCFYAFLSATHFLPEHL